MKLIDKTIAPDGEVYYHFWCPACDEPHTMDKRWELLLGDEESPTFKPSLLVRSGVYIDKDWAQKSDVSKEMSELLSTYCHTYITNGLIQYQHDSKHKFAGKTVKMIEWGTWAEMRERSKVCV